MNILIRIISICCFLTYLSSYAQDTLFVQSHNFDKYVSNISSDGQHLYLRIGDSIYSYLSGKKKYIAKAALRFSWIEKNDYADNYYWFHDNQIPKKYSLSNIELDGILPGSQNAFITTARINNDLFICYNGNVLEYKINELPKLVYRGKSVRHIYSDNHVRVISTYDGVFSQKLKAGSKLQFEGENIFPFSHGEFTKIGSDYFLCQSTKVYKYDEEENKLDEYQNFQENGQVRQLIEFGNNIVVVFVDGLALLDLVDKNVSEPLIKDKITRAKKIGSELIVVTNSGSIYRISRELKINKIQTNFSFEDVENVNNEIYIGGKSGLFKLNGNELVKLNSSREIYELHDYKGNLIFSNFNGLFVFINSSVIPIVNNVEFNRYALNHDEQLLYAGSINGLYIIRTGPFDLWLMNQKDKSIFKVKNYSRMENYIIFGALLLIIILLIVIVVRYSYRLRKRGIIWTENDFSIEFIEQVIKDQNIVSVEDLANQLNISRVHLNRKLSKYDTTALKVLKRCKNKMANELYKNGVSLENISKKLGYSKRYIRENFLNKA